MPRGYVIQGGYTVRSAEPDGFDPANAVGQFEAGLFPSGAGIGFGGDIGISGVLYRQGSLRNRDGSDPLNLGREMGDLNPNVIYYGITVQNLGSITWNNRTYERSQTGVRDTLSNGTISDERFQSYQGTLRPIGSFSTTLPAVLRAGVAANLAALTGPPGYRRPLMLDIEGEVPLNDVPGNSVDPRLSVGIDWPASDWPPRRRTTASA